MARFGRAILLAIAALALPSAALALPSAALARVGGTQAGGKQTIVVPKAEIALASSDVICNVDPSKVGPAVSCWHNPGSQTIAHVHGLMITASDRADVVFNPATPAQVVVAGKIEPSFARVPKITGGHALKNILTLHVGDAVGVGGTHMAIFGEKAPGGGNTIVIVHLDGSGNLIAGSYAIGIDDADVTITKVGKGGKLSLAFKHKVYG